MADVKFDPFTTEKKAPDIRKKWMDCLRWQQDPMAFVLSTLLKADPQNSLHTLNCFPIITKNPANIEPPSISIQKIDKMLC